MNNDKWMLDNNDNTDELIYNDYNTDELESHATP